MPKHLPLKILLSIVLLSLASATGYAQGTLFKFSLVTDLHYQKLDRAVSKLRLQDYVDTMAGWGPAFVVQNGDLIQGWSSYDQNLADMFSADSILDGLSVPRYNVIGNHELETNISLAEALNIFGADSSYYSFDRGGYHFIVLNAAYDTSGQPSNWHQGYIPSFEESWLVNDLANADKYTIVFLHHNIDNQAGVDTTYYVRDRRHIRHLLEDSGKVIAVFEGHLHVTYDWIHNNIAYYSIERGGIDDICTYSKIKLWPDDHLIEVIIRPVFNKMSFTYGPRAPLDFDLQGPADGVITATNQDTLYWERALDIDPNDPVTYTVYYDTDSSFSSPYSAGGITDTSWVMTPPFPADTRFFWKVEAEDGYSLTHISQSVFSFTTPPDTTVSSVTALVPLNGAAISAYPNPFSSGVTLRYFIQNPGAKVRVYDVRGRLVAEVAGDIEGTGWGTAYWNGKTLNGTPAGSGVYFGVIESGRAQKRCKLLLMK